MKFESPNMVLLSGSGRNVGKTTLACNFISLLGEKQKITALKLSPHFHKMNHKQILVHESDDFKIYRETDDTTNKDSSRMLRAGAENVYFIQAADKSIDKAWIELQNYLPAKGLIVCESGSLGQTVKPGIHFLLINNAPDHQKQSFINNLAKADYILTQNDFNETQLKFSISYNKKWHFKRNNMIKLDDALQILNETQKPRTATEIIDLKDVNGRILAKDVNSDMDFPSFDKSAMDGYAIKKEEIDQKLEVVEFIPAGKMPEKSIKSGECAKIMTGAMLPQGADMVVMVEDVSRKGDNIVINNLKSKSNILLKGEDVKTGDVVLKAGSLLNSATAGILASVGEVRPEVFKKPEISIISTGSELVNPSEKPVLPQIRNSNSSQLQVLAKASGANVLNTFTIEDDEKKIFSLVEQQLKISDIVILTGGASVGDLDFTSRVFEGLQAKIHFTKLSIQPGKPVLFATIGDKYLFGLSGNPVSSFVQFQLLVKPFISRFSGNNKQITPLKLPMAVEMKRRKKERALFFPVKINAQNKIETIEYHGSAHLNAYAEADAMACFPIGLNELKIGDLVDVRPL